MQSETPQYVYGDGIGSVTLIDYMGDDQRAAHAARVSFNNDNVFDDEGNITERDERLLKFLLRENHTSPFEHSFISFRLTVPMFVRSQIHRHRTFSYNEVSRRYTSEEISFYVPSEFRLQSTKNLQCSLNESLEGFAHLDTLRVYNDTLADCFKAYCLMLDMGVSREQARGLLPNSTYTSFWMSGNLRNYIHFLRLRLDAHAQPEVRLVAEAMREQLALIFPATFKVLYELGVLNEG